MGDKGGAVGRECDEAMELPAFACAMAWHRMRVR